MLRTEKKDGQKDGDPVMKINKEILKQLIKEEIASIEEVAGPSADVVKVKKYMDTYKLTELIATRIDTPQEFSALIKLMINLPGKVKPAQKSSILRTLITGVGKPEGTTQQQQVAPAAQPPVAEHRRPTKKRRK